MMRIITGSAKGIHLKTLEGTATRPTAERVKEALFSMLQFDLEGRRVLDLFSGSGQLALEALSRGAAFAVMVDKSRDAVRIMEQNALKTKLYDRCQIVQGEYSDYIRRHRGGGFDIVFLDPPYAADLYRPALQALWQYKLLKPTALIVCESESEEIFGNDETTAKKFSTVRVARYGRTYITVLSPCFEETPHENE